MNKYIVIAIVLVLIIGAGAVYRTFFLPEADKPVVTGVERDVSIVTFENSWRFVPEFLEVEQGDKVTITVTNRDEYDHGFAIDAFGISQRMPAKETIQVEFIATKAGDFPFYCSVSCGSGEVNGKVRGHFDHIGKMHVASLISETSDFGDVTEVSLTEVELKEQARRASAINTAKNLAHELSYDLDHLDSAFDEGNSKWREYVIQSALDVERINLPDDTEYQAVSFSTASEPILWVFLDTVGGEVINYFELYPDPYGDR
jgi:nitrosocyanin